MNMLFIIECHLFFPGSIIVTDGVAAILEETTIQRALIRHCRGDWGELCESDKKVNNLSLDSGQRLLSIYEQEGTRFYIITEADRSRTTVLLPSEY